ncbi:DUF5680 domain-containing protein [Thermoflavimicrobium daqui]|jgi:hypothetical protein|uniref:DUF5680 domain-containing protein n=1 Tax=Thermoflavimicrobium daqui TaxID=2137476 RepID=A0A364K8A9_9BACL|nr:DUF5680 domain-containing protein [Thermoflavimicrobium daqui]RAL26452.1 hypothetical protein DL897_05530 [Thermoflavimicrobium daqui]
MIQPLFDQKAFLSFLNEAQKSSFTSKPTNQAYSPPNSKQYEYDQDPFRYWSIYFGSLYFSGQDIVFLKNDPIWTMNYYGGITSDITDIKEITKIYQVLNEAIFLENQTQSLRGPAQMTKGSYLYSNQFNGSIALFTGAENIKCMCTGIEVFSLTYQGGFLK